MVTCTFRQFFKQHALQEQAPFLATVSDKPMAKPEEDDHACWTVEELPKGQVALRSYNGHYLSVNSHSQVHLSKERGQESHFMFVKEELDHAGCVAIKDHHGNFLTFDAHGHVQTKRHAEASEDPFHLPFFRMNEHKTATKAHHGAANHKHAHHGKDHL